MDAQMLCRRQSTSIRLKKFVIFIFIYLLFPRCIVFSIARGTDFQNYTLVPVNYCEHLCNKVFADIHQTRHSNNFLSKYKREAANLLVEPSKLTVGVGENQTVQLPNDQAVLSAFVLEKSPNYKYTWELIYPLNKEDIGNIEGINEAQVKLTHLKAGNYSFRVTVNGDGKSGSAIANLTVLPAITANKKPIVIIEPKNSTVQLPNQETVLDGSASYDDDQIVKYDWQAIKFPLAYKSKLPNSPTLKLQDLVPGYYVFNLTVTDSRNATNSTTATINVLKEIDYPPTANAGPDVVIHLPQDSVVLNGNKSLDDKGIVAWHWTSADGQMDVEMKGTTTPYLTLSNLRVGAYTFYLQVTDSANQVSDKSQTHVFVKPEYNEAPKANAGNDKQILLPLKSPILLDGSKSSDDIEIVKWNWTQLNGPKNLVIYDANSSIARIDSITPGIYNFSLTVWDIKNLTSSDQVIINVVQDRNLPPKAIAGGDKTVTLPVSEVLLDGSASFDDAEIVSFRWNRMSMSLAFGDFIGNSSNTSVLRLTNLVVGRYLFQLTVTDAHGASSSDVASLIVKPSVDILQQIEIVLNHDIQSFTYEQLNDVYRRLEIFLTANEPIHIKSVKVDKTRELRTVLIFSVHDDNNNTLKSVEIVRKIKLKLKTDPGFLPIQVLSADTLICQNNCSFHGTCDQYTKRCMCEAFWMENFIRLHFGDNQSNCEWSILYVIIICFGLLFSITVFLWTCVCLISRYQNIRLSSSSLPASNHGKRKYRSTNRFRYMLIDQCDNVEIDPINDHPHPHKQNHPHQSDDDDDHSDPLFNYKGKNHLKQQQQIGYKLKPINIAS